MPKCQQGCTIVRSHDELTCLVHGLVHSPKRAWDVAGESLMDRPADMRMRARIRSSKIGTPTLSLAEHSAVLAAERGDPDALDMDEFDAAIVGNTNYAVPPFVVKPVCATCGKRAWIKNHCLACQRKTRCPECDRPEGDYHQADCGLYPLKVGEKRK